MDSENNSLPKYDFEKIVDIIIRLGALFLLISWCFNILKPFILILVWAMVITIAIYPLFKIFVRWFGGKKIVASVVLIVLLLSIFIIPGVLITESLYEGIQHIRQLYNEGQPLIPPPGAYTANWPAFAKPVIDFWTLASENLQAAILKYPQQIKTGGEWLLSSLAGVGKGLLQFLVSLIISGVLLLYYAPTAAASTRIFKKLAGKHGEGFAPIAVATILNVFKGVFGVAIVQSSMAALGFFIAGVPFAGLWTILCFILAIMQIGIWPVVIPVVIYMFSVLTTGPAVALAIWLGLALFIDNVLRPILLGRGAPAPMLIVFLGSVGGFIYSGFLGLFLGAVILTIGYKIFLVWLDAEMEN